MSEGTVRHLVWYQSSDLAHLSDKRSYLLNIPIIMYLSNFAYEYYNGLTCPANHNQAAADPKYWPADNDPY